MSNRQPRTGFALVEMVIVIMMLGIIAVVTAPRLLDPQRPAHQEATRRQLAILRKAIELYEARTGIYPPTNQLPAAMTMMLNGPFPTPMIGSARGDAGVFYDRDPNVETLVVTDCTQTGGWAYKPVNGSLKLNLEANEVGADW
jgi:general secretion pathway protein G